MFIIDKISIKSMIIIYVISTALFASILGTKKLDYKKAKSSFFIFINFIISLFVFYILQNTVNIYHLFSGTLIIFGIINLIILKIFKLLKPIHGIFFAILTGIAINFSYISYTPYFVRQHDSRNFFAPEFGGHFGYIGYIFKNGHLPIGSPKDYWCFFNPPLFYLISAGFIKLQNNFGIEIEHCLENLQMLSLTYTIIFDIYVYRILKQLKIEKTLPIMLFIVLAPALVIMSGSLNNDILSITLSTMALFYAIKWFNTDKLSDLIKTAFCISLAIATKISAALISIVIAVLFLIRFVKNRKEFKKYLIHFGIFAIIALPIGLWFPIKNLVLYDIPPTYVQAVDLDNPSNISKYSVFDRFFKTASKKSLTDINITMSGKNIDYNLFVTTLKTFILDEHIDYDENPILDFAIHSVFYLAIIISVLFLINIIYLIINYKKINNHWILLLIFLLLLEIFSYVKFCFDFPMVFTMNFRYIVPTLISFAGLIGISNNHNKFLYYTNNTFLILFSICSIFMFMNM